MPCKAGLKREIGAVQEGCRNEWQKTQQAMRRKADAK